MCTMFRLSIQNWWTFGCFHILSVMNNTVNICVCSRGHTYLIKITNMYEIMVLCYSCVFNFDLFVWQHNIVERSTVQDFRSLGFMLLLTCCANLKSKSRSLDTGFCFRLNVCVPPELCWKLIHDMMVLGGGALGGV